MKKNQFNSARERTPLLVVAYALFLYFSGLSLRRVSEALALLGIRRSHEAVRKWVHRFGARMSEIMAVKAREWLSWTRQL